MNVLIAGCGYLGCAAGAVLSASGHRVKGLCRSEASADRIRSAGLTPLKADLTDLAALKKLPLGGLHGVILCQAPAKGEAYRAAYLEATETLLEALKIYVAPGADPLRLVFVSSTSVYGPRAGGWVDADTPIDPEVLEEDVRVLRRAEELVLAAGGRVLRLSGIYGPGRNRIEALKSGQFKPFSGLGYTNRIHRDDAARAAALVLENGRPGQIYLATDDKPASQTEFYGWLCGRMGLPAPAAQPAVQAAQAWADSKRCSNAKLKELGWSPRYAGYEQGYGELLG